MSGSDVTELANLVLRALFSSGEKRPGDEVANKQPPALVPGLHAVI